ncbi:arsenate reductase ArsC [Aquimarina sp. RZ0]|uniref:arsenate reductase ArsC n=1 Tax=Aquimarina sp. RZ0 TaxID=2607730 RepID=UPI0011F19778|nr:arsenate reductase ArsC [Aquimarina sp. RZ0]KAA1247731.1 arsenate reductase ArsC [Aquimarina sp. RZ0]
MTNILVLCTGNSCRSQMAEGYLKHFAQDTATIYSAGVETHGVNPRAIAIMKEDDIDISNHTSNNLEEYLDINFDYILTVCDHAKEKCPFFPGKAERLHYNFFDPSKIDGTEEEIHAAFTKTRNEIKTYCKNFVEKTVLNLSN